MNMRILAADIGGTNTKIGICDEQGNMGQFKEYATESHKGGRHVVSRLLDQLAEYDYDYDAIAISTAGQVNAEEGSIVYANENIPNYTGTKLREMIEGRFHKPVKVENDVNAAALGEAAFGAARSFGDFLCLTFGTGIGGAIIINRQIYRGANGVAAEFGHIFTRPLAGMSGGAGRPHYESHASTTALIRKAREADPECVDGKVFFDKISKGNVGLQHILHDWTAEVSLGLASLIHVFNPSAIIVGGGVMEQESLVRLVAEGTKAMVMPSFADVSIVKASLGNKAGLLGAASLFLR
ncbi:Beta-glucoside kinase [Paenibacillus plantiphilus]|uniref:Beta-glucoside kinase n=1 Tax=Paenibacillus plantiphilus TaxID=2905650 RepID=A0ABM9C2V9_9BACL|nr:ROK family protein [Paenibacillus plantiphilus]CAH1200577.1 Beta-glucoside kinase [Paenibacillus plantiphilus]